MPQDLQAAEFDEPDWNSAPPDALTLVCVCVCVVVVNSREPYVAMTSL